MSGLLAAVLAGLAVFVALSRGRPVPRVPPRRSARVPRPGHLDLVEFHAQLAALARAGLEPADALEQVTAANPGQVPAELVRIARGNAACDRDGPAPPDPRFAALAATLTLVQATGAPAAPTLARLAQAAAEEDEARLAVRSALAAPRATARVLTALPLIGLALGQAMGADPVRVLLTTGPGRIAAVVGVLGAVLAALWSRRLVRAATAPR